eukprot:TRINITY_DN55848_c0_g1_i1.p1 TRINITY_DN55848_c0_g1~~TRINITY_DN55848_c0_g1_i1.p1  ORF type:complete len:318 (-),score=40.74 TRINITY_DN55848_c0_g1_i1:259-1212(-)
MTLQQLRTFAQNVRGMTDEGKIVDESVHSHTQGQTLRWEEVNVYHIYDHVVVPRTKDRACSYMELVALGPQKSEFHVSQPWLTPFKLTMSAIEWHAEALLLPDTTVYWIDVFAFNWHDPSRDQHRYNVEEAAFHRVLADATGLVVVLDRDASAMGRAWVVLELYTALALKKSVDLLCDTGCVATTRPFAAGVWEFGDFDHEIASRMFERRVQDSESSHPDGRTNVLNAICKTDSPPTQHREYDRFNERINRAVAGPLLRHAASIGCVERVARVFAASTVSANAASLRGLLGEGPIHMGAAAGRSGGAKPRPLAGGHG